MERTITKRLVKWKEDPEKKPLVISGVRQCGKTYAVKDFGARFYEDAAYFSFDEDDRLSAVFDHDLDVFRIIDELGNIIRGKEIVPGKTLLILDEIQNCPKAITALKYFCENMRNLDVICAGSLLGIKLRNLEYGGIESSPYPVGKVNRMTMYPMSFYEFALADGNKKLIEGAGRADIEAGISDLYTIPLQKELRYYYITGGMPEAVASWVKYHQISKVDEIQDEILSGYADDLVRHAPKREYANILQIWDSVPVQLAKENNKFVFSHVAKGKRAADLENSLIWLEGAGLCAKLCLVSEPSPPLSFYADKTYFKMYMSDIGLLRRKCGVPADAILDRNDAYSRFKGAFVENYTFTELIKLGISPYFWRSGNEAELDFLFEENGNIIPLEVKSAVNTRARSYREFVKRYSPHTGFRLSMKNSAVNEENGTINVSIPLYMLWNIHTYMDKVMRR